MQRIQLPTAQIVQVINRVPGSKRISSVWRDFATFINRGSVVDVATGVIMGAAFTSIVNSLVSDIFSPFIGLASNGVNLEQLFVVMRPGKNCTNNANNTNNCVRFNTIAEAQLAGAVTWNYGRFLNNCVNFVITSIIVYFLVKSYTRTFRKEPKTNETPVTKECPYCIKKIDIKASRCPECTSYLQDTQIHN
jgi:large conductance mechanosensitive channel